MERKEFLQRLVEFGRIEPDPLYVVMLSNTQEPKVFRHQDDALNYANKLAARLSLVEMETSNTKRDEGQISQFWPENEQKRWPRIWVYESTVTRKKPDVQSE